MLGSTRMFSMLALGVSAAAGVVAGCNAWLLWASREALYVDASSVPVRKVALVLGARAYAHGPSAVLEDRLAAALALYELGRVERILVSGDHGGEPYDEVHTMHRWLRDKGVDDAHIFLDHAGFRTLDSVQRAARVFGVREAVICTQHFHLPRALWLAERAGIDAVGLVADRRAYRAAMANQVREAVARVVAVGDVHVWGREPRFLGPSIPIDGDSRLSHDRTTRR